MLSPVIVPVLLTLASLTPARRPRAAGSSSSCAPDPAGPLSFTSPVSFSPPALVIVAEPTYRHLANCPSNPRGPGPSAWIWVRNSPGFTVLVRAYGLPSNRGGQGLVSPGASVAVLGL